MSNSINANITPPTHSFSFSAVSALIDKNLGGKKSEIKRGGVNTITAKSSIHSIKICNKIQIT